MRRFREARLSHITSQHESIPKLEGAGAKYVLHLLPLSAFEPTAAVDISRLDGREWGPSVAFPYSRSRHHRFNFEGFIIQDFPRFDDESSGYVQIFRSGAVEAAKALINGEYIDNTFELIIIKRAEEYLKIQQELEVQAPMLAMLTLWGVNDKPLMAPPNKPSPPSRFDRDVLPLPECVVDDFDASVTHALRPAFDAMYQAAGSPRSPSYDENGEWVGITSF